MQVIKKPKGNHDSTTLRDADRSRFCLYGMAALVVIGCIGFGYLPKKHQIIVGTGLATGTALLAKLGIDFTGNIKTERLKFGDIETPHNLPGSDIGKGLFLAQLTQEELDDLETSKVRKQNPSYVPKV